MLVGPDKLVFVFLLCFICFPCFFVIFYFQRSADLSDLESDYDDKQHHLDILQGEVVKLEGIVASISENVRERAQLQSPSNNNNTVGASALLSPTQSSQFTSPSNRLAVSAANAAAVARKMAEEEDRQFSASMHRLELSSSASSVRSPYRADRSAANSASVQRSLQSQLSELEQEAQAIAANRRANGL